jgi:hypothetical protein
MSRLHLSVVKLSTRLGCTASAVEQGPTKGFLQKFKFSGERTISAEKMESVIDCSFS